MSYRAATLDGETALSLEGKNLGELQKAIAEYYYSHDKPALVTPVKLSFMDDSGNEVKCVDSSLDLFKARVEGEIQQLYLNEGE